MGEQFYSHELAKRFANPVDMSDAAFIRDISRRLTEKATKIAALEAELADLRAKGTPAQSDIACAIATRALISEGYNDGDIESVIAAHVAPLRARLDEAEGHLAHCVQMIQWMSGSNDFSPDGQAHQGWLKMFPGYEESRHYLATLTTPTAEKGAGDE